MPEKITWVIGDIHGMFDPLKKLIEVIRRYHYAYGLEVEKIIFLGDYIDFGPSSKEVIDLIINLEFNKVCLMGNHEDLLLQFMDKSELFQKYNNIWFDGNGGIDTITSFFPNEAIYKKILLNRYKTFITWENLGIAFEEKHLNFFKNLKIWHTEEVEFCHRDLKFLFVHGGVNDRYTFADIKKIQDYKTLHEDGVKRGIWIEKTILWSREEYKQKFEDFIIINAHTPTLGLKNYYKDIGNYDTNSGYPFFNFVRENKPAFTSEDSTIKFKNKIDELVSIDIDTGAVFGKYLTAFGILNTNILNSRFKVLQALASESHRNNKDVRELEFEFTL